MLWQKLVWSTALLLTCLAAGPAYGQSGASASTLPELTRIELSVRVDYETERIA